MLCFVGFEVNSDGGRWGRCCVGFEGIIGESEMIVVIALCRSLSEYQFNCERRACIMNYTILQVRMPSVRLLYHKRYDGHAHRTRAWFRIHATIIAAHSFEARAGVPDARDHAMASKFNFIALMNIAE